ERCRLCITKPNLTYARPQIHAYERVHLDARARLDEKEPDAAVRTSQHDEQLGRLGPAHEALTAAQPFFFDLRARVRRVEVERLVEKRERDAHFAVRDEGQPALLLRRAAKARNREGADRGVEIGAAKERAPELFDEDRALDHAEPGAAVGFR